MSLKQTLKNSAFPPEKNKYLPLEALNTDRAYALTLSPRDQYFEQPLRYLRCYEQLLDTLQKTTLGQFIKFQIYPEISTKKQNIHWHGYMWFTSYLNIARFYLHVHLIKDDYQIEIDTLSGYMWYPYIMKTRHIMEPLCTYHKLPYKITDEVKLPKEKNRVRNPMLDK